MLTSTVPFDAAAMVIFASTALSDVVRCAWESLTVMMSKVREEDNNNNNNNNAGRRYAADSFQESWIRVSCTMQEGANRDIVCGREETMLC